MTIPHPGGIAGAVHTARAAVAAGRNYRPDVLHEHMMASAVTGFAAARLVRAPLVTTVHNSFDRHSALMRLATSSSRSATLSAASWSHAVTPSGRS
jgi:hypothetical protein